MRHDSLSDALITIKNADHVGKDSAVVPASRLIGEAYAQSNGLKSFLDGQVCGTCREPCQGDGSCG